jgi:hypothetical protein
LGGRLTFVAFVVVVALAPAVGAQAMMAPTQSRDASVARDSNERERETPAEEAADRARRDVPDNQADVSETEEASDTESLEVNDEGGPASQGPMDLALDREGHEFRAGELVMVADAADAARIERLGVAIIERRRLGGLGGFLIRIESPNSEASAGLRDKLRLAAPAAAVDLNHVYRLAAAISSERPAASPSGRTMHSGMVGLLDTAVDPHWPGLGRSVVEARSFAPSASAKPIHGAAVAYLAARQGARILAAGVFSRTPDGGDAASVDAMARAVDWLVSRDVAVINLSLAGPPNSALAEIIRRAQQHGCLVVAAAGNAGPAAPPAYPAAYPSVVAVTAVDSADNPYVYANRGGYIMFAARGVDIAVPAKNQTPAVLSGTSFAAPVVAALAATKLDHPDPARAANAIESLKRDAKHLGLPGRNDVFGYGRLGD